MSKSITLDSVSYYFEAFAIVSNGAKIGKKFTFSEPKKILKCLLVQENSVCIKRRFYQEFQINRTPIFYAHLVDILSQDDANFELTQWKWNNEKMVPASLFKAPVASIQFGISNMTFSTKQGKIDKFCILPIMEIEPG